MIKKSGSYRVLVCVSLAMVVLFVPVLATLGDPMLRTDLFGPNIGRGTVVLQEWQCAQLCESTSGCVGSTFVKAGVQGADAYCWMKSQVANTIPDQDCCTSRVVQAVPGGGCSGCRPAGDFKGVPITGSVPLDVQFTDLTNCADSWEWSFGDGGTSAKQNPLHKYAASGSYTVLLKVTNSYTGSTCNPDDFKDTETKINYITVTASPATGSISVISNPPGAVVIVDGTQQAGTTPLTVPNQNPGSHAVVVRMSDYSDFTTTAQVSAGQTITVNAPLTKISPTAGSLLIISTPDGAAITVDGGPQGTTPKTISGLAAGSHTVKLTKSGYTDYQAPVSVVAGKTTQLTVPLVSGNGPSPTATSTKTSPASTGSISVSSSPSGAGINLDGWEKGKTPATLDQVKAGSHTLTLSLSGYADRILTVPVDAGKVTTVTASLIPSPSSTPAGSGTLTIRSDPQGANVYLDGEKVGNTPVQLQGVRAGTHNLLLTMSGYGDVTRTIEMASGSDKDVSIDLGIKSPGFGLPLALAALLVVTLLLVQKRKQR